MLEIFVVYWNSFSCNSVILLNLKYFVHTVAYQYDMFGVTHRLPVHSNVISYFVNLLKNRSGFIMSILKQLILNSH